MKTNILIILITLLTAFQINAQDLNQEITDKGGSPFLLGKINKEGLEGDNYKSWFTKNYDAYEPSSEVINAITSKLKTYFITLFLGTWCGDSQQEVPKLYKVLEASNFPMEQLTVIALSRQSDMYKQSPQHEEAGLNIHRVPTIIFYKDNKEINRIVEHPIGTFEDDIQNIITTNNYKSNYQIVTEVDNLLKKKGAKGLNRKQKNLIKTFKDETPNMYGLNTYGYILYSNNKIEDAIAVYYVNTKMFPEQPRTHINLANTLNASNKKAEAIKVLEKAIKLHPKNDDLKENLNLMVSK